MNERIAELQSAGVSIWLDDLSRERLQSGNLEELINTRGVVGVTTNPTIFAGALDSPAYTEQLRELAASGADAATAVRTITTDDVRSACDVFAEVFAASQGRDGRVSIEVDPQLAMDTEATIAEAKALAKIVDRPGVHIKIPATRPGLPAITETIASGISVNVTLIFSLQRYREVIAAYLTGLEQAAANGHDLAQIHSVASFFVSRVDSEVDRRLTEIGTEPARALLGSAAIANARLAYRVFTQTASGELAERWAALVAQGANPQRPLWASTGTKNPEYSDTRYVTELVAADTVNTMPEKTLEAFADHGEPAGDQVTEFFDDAAQVIQDLSDVGVDLDEVVQVLEREGVQKFTDSWLQLLTTVGAALESHR